MSNNSGHFDMQKRDIANNSVEGKLLRKATFKDDSNQIQNEDSILCCGKRIRPETLLIILTIIGVVLGIILGVSLLPLQPSEDAISLIMFPGEILMRLLKQLIIPIILTSVITGIASLDTRKSGKIAIHAMAYYISTTLLAIILGIALVSIIKPGQIPQVESGQSGSGQKTVSTLDTFLDLIRNMFPSNIIAACFQVDRTSVSVTAEWNDTVNDTSSNATSTLTFHKKLEKASSTNILGLISFSIFFGIITARLGKEADIVTRFVAVLNKIFLKMIGVVIWYSPIGICSLVSGNILKMKGVEVLIQKLGLYFVTVISGLAIHGLLLLPAIYWIFTRKNPFAFFMATIQALLTGLGTGTSVGTLPVTIKCLENNLKVDPRVARFVLPLGATINMDGTALLEAVAAITIAQMNGLPLNFGQIITISITATAASIGAAAIPSAGLITLMLVLSAIGVPTDLVVILWSVDWFLDRIRTAINILGDCVGASIIHHVNRDFLARSTFVVGVDDEMGERATNPEKEDGCLCDSGVSLRNRGDSYISHLISERDASSGL